MRMNRHEAVSMNKHESNCSGMSIMNMYKANVKTASKIAK